MEKKKVILDVDTGTDDAIAIMTAVMSETLEVLGVCAVNGNRGIDFTTENTLRVIEYLSSMDAFSYRRAVPYVASHLGVSRYTVYKYLDEVNGKINKASAKDKED